MAPLWLRPRGRRRRRDRGALLLLLLTIVYLDYLSFSPGGGFGVMFVSSASLRNQQHHPSVSPTLSPVIRKVHHHHKNGTATSSGSTVHPTKDGTKKKSVESRWCIPSSKLSKKQCKKLISGGCKNLMYVGKSCPGEEDGGCQMAGPFNHYCGWKCSKNCLKYKLDRCAWDITHCRYTETYTPTMTDMPTTVYPTSFFPSRVPTTSPIQSSSLYFAIAIGDACFNYPKLSLCGLLVSTTQVMGSSDPSAEAYEEPFPAYRGMVLSDGSWVFMDFLRGARLYTPKSTMIMWELELGHDSQKGIRYFRWIFEVASPFDNQKNQITNWWSYQIVDNIKTHCQSGDQSTIENMFANPPRANIEQALSDNPYLIFADAGNAASEEDVHIPLSLGIFESRLRNGTISVDAQTALAALAKFGKSDPNIANFGFGLFKVVDTFSNYSLEFSSSSESDKKLFVDSFDPDSPANGCVDWYTVTEQQSEVDMNSPVTPRGEIEDYIANFNISEFQVVAAMLASEQDTSRRQLQTKAYDSSDPCTNGETEVSNCPCQSQSEILAQNASWEAFALNTEIFVVYKAAFDLLHTQLSFPLGLIGESVSSVLASDWETELTQIFVDVENVTSSNVRVEMLKNIPQSAGTTPNVITSKLNEAEKNQLFVMKNLFSSIQLMYETENNVRLSNLLATGWGSMDVNIWNFDDTGAPLLATEIEVTNAFLAVMDSIEDYLHKINQNLIFMEEAMLLTLTTKCKASSMLSSAEVLNSIFQILLSAIETIKMFSTANTVALGLQWIVAQPTFSIQDTLEMLPLLTSWDPDNLVEPASAATASLSTTLLQAESIFLVSTVYFRSLSTRVTFQALAAKAMSFVEADSPNGVLNAIVDVLSSLIDSFNLLGETFLNILTFLNTALPLIFQLSFAFSILLTNPFLEAVFSFLLPAVNLLNEKVDVLAMETCEAPTTICGSPCGVQYCTLWLIQYPCGVELCSQCTIGMITYPCSQSKTFTVLELVNYVNSGASFLTPGLAPALAVVAQFMASPPNTTFPATLPNIPSEIWNVLIPELGSSLEAAFQIPDFPFVIPDVTVNLSPDAINGNIPQMETILCSLDFNTSVLSSMAAIVPWVAPGEASVAKYSSGLSALRSALLDQCPEKGAAWDLSKIYIQSFTASELVCNVPSLASPIACLASTCEAWCLYAYNTSPQKVIDACKNGCKFGYQSLNLKTVSVDVTKAGNLCEIKYKDGPSDNSTCPLPCGNVCDNSYRISGSCLSDSSDGICCVGLLYEVGVYYRACLDGALYTSLLTAGRNPEEFLVQARDCNACIPTPSPSGPTLAPSFQPTLMPTSSTLRPTSIPTIRPSGSPTQRPKAPSLHPLTLGPSSRSPTLSPSEFPSRRPTSAPTSIVSSLPTAIPTRSPIILPTTASPQTSSPTSNRPTTMGPTSPRPTARPTIRPTTPSPISSQPTTNTPSTSTPTTGSPTTVRPTSVHPTTSRPSTTSPTTIHPTTAHPTSMHPSTRSPTTINPSTISPTTALPSTKSPVTTAPTTTRPSLSPTTLYPTTKQPATTSPTSPTNQPSTKHPTTEQPSAASPTTAQPSTTAQPITFSPTAHPKTVQPSTKSPTTLQPSTASPSTPRPHTGMPTTLSPITARPVTLSPETFHPTTISPTFIPTTGSPKTLNPSTSVPTTFQPTPSPTTFRPTRLPSTPNPVTSSPTARPSTKPTTTVPQTSSPLMPKTPRPITESPTSRPVTSIPTTPNPTTVSPTTHKPATSNPTGFPTTSKPVISNPTTASPTTTNPNISPSTSKPVTSNPTGFPTTASPTTSNPTGTALPTTSNPIGSPTTPKPVTSNPTGFPTTSKPVISSPTKFPTTALPTTSNPTTISPTTHKPATSNPTKFPTTSKPVTSNPTKFPTTALPTTSNPTILPTTSNPTELPTTSKPVISNPTKLPSTLNPFTQSPTTKPTLSPIAKPLIVPSTSPKLNVPSFSPTVLSTPTIGPRFRPSSPPSIFMTSSPTLSPRFAPTTSPTDFPTKTPTQNPV